MSSGESIGAGDTGPVDFLPAPLIINWSLSFRCNFDCSHCYSRLDKSPELDTGRIIGIAGRLAAAGVLFVNFGGGEPMLRDDLLKIAKAASGRNLKVSMNSNGSLIDREAAKNLKESGFASVGISIDSHDPLLHDRFRNRKGSHKKAVMAVGHLREAGLNVTISSVISTLNHRDLSGLVDMAHELGASQLFLHNFKCSGKGMDKRFELDLEPAEWRNFYREALALVRSGLPIPVSFDDPIINSLNGGPEPGPVRGSTCGKVSLNIRPNGDITPCGFIPIVLGNALEDDLLTLWKNSPILQKMRGKTPKGKCVTCPSYADCLGGCTARAYAVTGDMEEPDPHCWHGQH